MLWRGKRVIVPFGGSADLTQTPGGLHQARARSRLQWTVEAVPREGARRSSRLAGRRIPLPGLQALQGHHLRRISAPAGRFCRRGRVPRAGLRERFGVRLCVRRLQSPRAEDVEDSRRQRSVAASDGAAAPGNRFAMAPKYGESSKSGATVPRVTYLSGGMLHTETADRTDLHDSVHRAARHRGLADLERWEGSRDQRSLHGPGRARVRADANAILGAARSSPDLRPSISRWRSGNPTFNQPGTRGILMSYIYERLVEEIAQMPQAQIDRTLELFEQIHPGRARERQGADDVVMAERALFARRLSRHEGRPVRPAQGCPPRRKTAFTSRVSTPRPGLAGFRARCTPGCGQRTK